MVFPLDINDSPYKQNVGMYQIWRTNWSTSCWFSQTKHKGFCQQNHNPKQTLCHSLCNGRSPGQFLSNQPYKCYLHTHTHMPHKHPCHTHTQGILSIQQRVFLLSKTKTRSPHTHTRILQYFPQSNLTKATNSPTNTQTHTVAQCHSFCLRYK